MHLSCSADQSNIGKPYLGKPNALVPVGDDGDLLIGLPDDWVDGEGCDVVGASPVAGRYIQQLSKLKLAVSK